MSGTINQFLNSNRKEILRICAKHGASNVRVFGSMARGDDGPDSDVDLLVDVGGDHTPWFPGGLIVDLQDLLGRKVDVVEPEAVHWYIRDRVLKEAVHI